MKKGGGVDRACHDLECSLEPLEILASFMELVCFLCLGVLTHAGCKAELDIFPLRGPRGGLPLGWQQQQQQQQQLHPQSQQQAVTTATTCHHAAMTPSITAQLQWLRVFSVSSDLVDAV